MLAKRHLYSPKTPTIHRLFARYIQKSTSTSDYTTAPPRRPNDTPPENASTKNSTDGISSPPSPPQEEKHSALAQRLEDLAESAVLASPNNPHTTILSDDLKTALERRIAAAEFSSEYSQSIAFANVPASAPKHSRDLAGATPWTGTESQEDAVLRMLTDSHKPLKHGLRGKPSLQSVGSLWPKNTFQPPVVAGTRVARARDKSLEYSISKDKGLTPEERKQVKDMFKDRFEGPAVGGGGSVASVSAIMSLADKRIEDARARGQFNDLPRGKPLEKDHMASSPYLDTTEYFLNKIIQRQEVLPPWVEKQQELNRTVDGFRQRLRGDWKRFAARSIAARGGTLEQQIKTAEKYAEAEARRVRLENFVRRIKNGEDVPTEEVEHASDGPKEVFRDATWEKTELSYNKLQIEHLNELTRSYNLVAPDMAKKPLFSLERELNKCFAEVAPQVASEIRERARRPKGSMLNQGRRKDGWIGKLGIGEEREYHQAVVYDSVKPNYGFKEFWRDIFGRKEKNE